MASLAKERTDCGGTLCKFNDVATVLIDYCDFGTRRYLAGSCPQMHKKVTKVWAHDSRRALATFGLKVRGTAPWNECEAGEIRATVDASKSEQLFVCVPLCALLFFAKHIANRWFVVKFSADVNGAVIVWNYGSRESFAKQRIGAPLTEVPAIECSVCWKTEVSSTMAVADTARMHLSGHRIAVGMFNDSVVVLDSHTGAVVSDVLQGAAVAILEPNRVVGVLKEESGSDECVLLEFTDNALSRRLPFVAKHVESVKALANGKRVLIGTDSEMLEYCTITWTLIARIVFDGKPIGQCDIGSNGLLVQAIKHKDEVDAVYDIVLFETQTRSVTQTIQTSVPTVERIRVVVLSPNCSHFLVCTFEGAIQLFDTQSGKQIGETRFGHTNTVSSIAWLSDEWFVATFVDSSIVIWNVAAKEFALRIENAHQNRIGCVLRLSEHSFATGGIGCVKKWSFDVAADGSAVALKRVISAMPKVDCNWNCVGCTFLNPAVASECVVCGRFKPSDSSSDGVSDDAPQRVSTAVWEELDAATRALLRDEGVLVFDFDSD